MPSMERRHKVPKFKKLVPCREWGRQAVIYLVGVANNAKWYKHFADTGKMGSVGNVPEWY